MPLILAPAASMVRGTSRWSSPVKTPHLRSSVPNYDRPKSLLRMLDRAIDSMKPTGFVLAGDSRVTQL